MLAEQLKSNHTLLGLHFDGGNNKGYVDPNGFLIPLACKDKQPKIIAQPCWVCCGWREHKFYFRENGSLREIARPEEDDAVCQYGIYSRIPRAPTQPQPLHHLFLRRNSSANFSLTAKRICWG